MKTNKLQKMAEGQYFITVPRWLVNHLKLKKGQLLSWELQGDQMVLKRKSK